MKLTSHLHTCVQPSLCVQQGLSRRAFGLALGLIFGLTPWNLNSAGVCDELRPFYTNDLEAVRLYQPQRDVGIEAEWYPTESFMSLISSTDGTLKPILDHIQGQKPAFLKELCGTECDTWPFEKLSFTQKQELLKATIQRPDIMDNRSLLGWRFRDVIPISHPVTFEGQTYQDTFPLGRFLDGHPRYDLPDDPRHFALVEISLRYRTKASSLQKLLWDLESATGFSRPQGYPSNRASHHIHIVTPIPQQAIDAEGELAIRDVVDFYRRSNLVAEMISVVVHKRGIHLRHSPNSTLSEDHRPVTFGSMPWHYLLTIAQHLKRSPDHRRSLQHDTKIAWIGFRSGEIYQDLGLMGWEYRAANYNNDEVVMYRILDSLQYWLENYPLRVSTRRLRDFSDPKQDLQQLSYNKPWPVIWYALPPQLKIITPLQLQKLALLYESRHQEVKMLFYDWSNDPYVRSSPVFNNHLVEVQKRAIKRMLQVLEGKSSEAPQEIVRDFLLESRLFDFFSNTLVEVLP